MVLARIRRSARPAAVAARAALLLGALAGAALLAACGGSSGAAAAPTAGASSPAPSATASAGGSPLTGTAKEAVAEFWRLVDADAFEALAAAAAPGATGLPTEQSDDIEQVELLRVVQVERQPGSALAQVDVRVVPTGDSTPWGAPGRHTLFVRLLEQRRDEWLVGGWGTSP